MLIVASTPAFQDLGDAKKQRISQQNTMEQKNVQWIYIAMEKPRFEKENEYDLEMVGVPYKVDFTTGWYFRIFNQWDI